MDLAKELKNIHNVGLTAWTLVLKGEFRSARRTVKKLSNSFCISESERAIALVEAKILERCGKYREARERILQSICYLWGTREAFDILSSANPPIDKDSNLYSIEILGGLATLGAFTQFSEEHIGSFHVIANSEEEALSYIDDICCFADPDCKEVLKCEIEPLDDIEHTMHRGVVRAYPFEVME